MARKAFKPRAFTLIELLVVIGIIVILAGVSVPAVRMLAKSNDESQSANLVRSMIANARSIAISQHRMVGVVFFEESAQFALPANPNQTAMQIFVEYYDQLEFQQAWGALPPGATGFVYHSTARQYLPTGLKLAVLSDTSANVQTGDQATGSLARAILFDANGSLITRGGLVTPQPGNQTPGTYPQAYGDWKFTPNGAASSYPGFFLYNKADYDAQPEANRISWLKQNANVILVNANTGTILQ